MSPIGIRGGLRHDPRALWPPITVGLGGLGLSGLAKLVARDVVSEWLRAVDRWIADGATWMLTAAWAVLSKTTEPVISGRSFSSELSVMMLIGAGAVVPLLGLSVIQAVARQDGGGLVRTALIRLPLALLFTGVAVELVSLGLAFTDQASAALLATAGNPTEKLFSDLEQALAQFGVTGIGQFGGVLVLVFAAVIAFCVWLELAVRSAAVAAATLFLPLALAGLVWPATSHWARRLGETLAALVLMKLVMAGVLALAAGAVTGDDAGISGVVEGMALLCVTAVTPFALMRLIPMIETGAAVQLEGVSRRAIGGPAKSASWIAAHAFTDGAAGAAVGASERGTGVSAPAGGTDTGIGGGMGATRPGSGESLARSGGGVAGTAASVAGSPPAGGEPSAAKSAESGGKLGTGGWQSEMDKGDAELDSAAGLAGGPIVSDAREGGSPGAR